MAAIKINVSLYGALAHIGGGKYVAQMDIELEPGAQIGDLLARLGVSDDQKSYLFVNAVLCDVPGLSASVNEPLGDGDHVGIFSTGYMWPYQYRDGIRMSASLTEALRARGAMHNTY